MDDEGRQWSHCPCPTSSLPAQCRKEKWDTAMNYSQEGSHILRQ